MKVLAESDHKGHRDHRYLFRLNTVLVIVRMEKIVKIFVCVLDVLKNAVIFSFKGMPGLDIVGPPGSPGERGDDGKFLKFLRTNYSIYIKFESKSDER